MRTTAELRPGDVITVIRGMGRHIVRTIDTVGPHPDPTYVNHRGDRIWHVTYQEPASQEWGSGNACLADTWWHVHNPKGGSS